MIKRKKQLEDLTPDIILGRLKNIEGVSFYTVIIFAFRKKTVWVFKGDELKEVSFTALAKIKAVVEAKSTEYLGEVYQAAYGYAVTENPVMLTARKSLVSKHVANEEILSLLDNAIAAKESKKEQVYDSARG